MTRIRLLVAAVAAAAACTASPALAAPHGPDPTAAALQADGPYRVTQAQIPDSATNGFGAATVSYPADATDGPFSGIAVVPGFVSPKALIDWYGPRLASHGFVVITFDTTTIFDLPGFRGDELLSALDFLTSAADPARGELDAGSLGVMGHSMGGGGALEAAAKRPSIKASIPLTGWDAPQFGVKVPTLVIAADADVIAPNFVFSDRFYDALAGPKAEATLTAATHFTPNTPDNRISLLAIAWMKRFLDGDTRYAQFLCPGPSAYGLGGITGFKATCPL